MGVNPYRNDPKFSDTQNIGCNHSKIWTIWLYHRLMSPNDADGMANSVDPDQTAPLGAVWSGSALFAQAYLSENLGSLWYVPSVLKLGHWQTVQTQISCTDSDQLPHSAASDQGQHCLLTGISIKNKIKMKMYTRHPKNEKMKNGLAAYQLWKEDKSAIYNLLIFYLQVEIYVLFRDIYLWPYNTLGCEYPKHSDTQQNRCNNPKIWTMWFYYRVMYPKDANSEDVIRQQRHQRLSVLNQFITHTHIEHCWT